MDQKELQRLAYFQVDRYLGYRPELNHIREDLVQDAYIAMLKAQTTFNSSKGYPLGLWLSYHASYAVRRKGVEEQKHFKSPETDTVSPYWDLTKIPDVDDIPTESPTDFNEILRDLLWGIEFTPNQKVVLETFLETGAVIDAVSILKVSTSRVYQIYNDIIKKIRKANGLE